MNEVKKKWASLSRGVTLGRVKFTMGTAHIKPTKTREEKERKPEPQARSVQAACEGANRRGRGLRLCVFASGLGSCCVHRCCIIRNWEILMASSCESYCFHIRMEVMKKCACGLKRAEGLLVCVCVSVPLLSLAYLLKCWNIKTTQTPGSTPQQPDFFLPLSFFSFPLSFSLIFFSSLFRSSADFLKNPVDDGRGWISIISGLPYVHRPDVYTMWKICKMSLKYSLSDVRMTFSRCFCDIYSSLTHR